MISSLPFPLTKSHSAVLGDASTKKAEAGGMGKMGSGLLLEIESHVCESPSQECPSQLGAFSRSTTLNYMALRLSSSLTLIYQALLVF